MKTIANFRAAIHREGERSVCPGLPAMLVRERAVRGHRLRWAAAAAGVTLMLAAIPFYQYRQRQREAAQEQADTLLFEQVNAGLSRSVSPSLQPLLGTLPGN